MKVAIAALSAALSLAACTSSTTGTNAEPTPPATRTITATTTKTEVRVHTRTKTKQPIVKKVVATKTRTMTVTYTPPPPKQYGEGTYVVHVDIRPGYYHTSGGSDCYWARLASLDTSDIIDNSVSSGPQTVQIERSDKAFEIEGSCTFGRE